MKRLQLVLCLFSFVVGGKPVWGSSLRCSELFDKFSGDKIPYAELSAKEMTDIRNFDTRLTEVKPSYGHITIRSDKVHVNIALSPLESGSFVLNINVSRQFDKTYVKWLIEAIGRQFQEFAQGSSKFQWSGQDFLPFRLENLSGREAAERLSQLEKLIAKATPNPFDAIPASLAKKTTSEKREFLRNLLVDFLIENGVTAKEKFYDRNISLIHRLLIQDLTAHEVGIFHYSLFDRNITFEAQAHMEHRVEKINEVQAVLGLEPLSMENLIKGIRKKAVDIARDLQKEFERNEAELLEAKKLTKEYREAKVEERIAAVEKEITEFLLEARRSKINSFGFMSWNQLIKAYSENPVMKKLQARKKALLKKKEKYSVLHFMDVREAQALVKREEEIENNSNFNPYALDADFATIFSRVHIDKSQGYGEYTGFKLEKNSQVFSGKVSGPGKKSLDRSVLEIDNYGSYADMNVRLKDSAMSPEMASMLRQVGIEYIYEITKFSAKDFVDKFSFSEKQMHKLLDELNVLGIHLHFDGKWDANNLRIRKERTEFYQQRHTPKGNGVIDWREAYVPDKKGDLE